MRRKTIKPVEERLKRALVEVKKKNRDHLFKPGIKPAGSGRKKGTPNKTTRILKEATILAAESVGYDGKGQDGLVGYLAKCAKTERPAFMKLLEKLLPYQVVGKDGGAVQFEYHSADDVRERMKEKGLPPIPSLIDGPAASKSVN